MMFNYYFSVLQCTQISLFTFLFVDLFLQTSISRNVKSLNNQHNAMKSKHTRSVNHFVRGTNVKRKQRLGMLNKKVT